MNDVNKMTKVQLIALVSALSVEKEALEAQANNLTEAVTTLGEQLKQAQELNEDLKAAVKLYGDDSEARETTEDVEEPKDNLRDLLQTLIDNGARHIERNDLHINPRRRGDERIWQNLKVIKNTHYTLCFPKDFYEPNIKDCRALLGHLNRQAIQADLISGFKFWRLEILTRDEQFDFMNDNSNSNEDVEV